MRPYLKRLKLSLRARFLLWIKSIGLHKRDYSYGREILLDRAFFNTDGSATGMNQWIHAHLTSAQRNLYFRNLLDQYAERRIRKSKRKSSSIRGYNIP